MKIFAVIDTNVIVSALLAKTTDTPPAQVLMHLLNGDFVPVFSSDIILEYLQVLKRKHKYVFEDEYVEDLVWAIKQRGIELTPAGIHEGVKDEKDYVFYEVAIAKEETYLVTGNLKHFPQSPIVVSPKEFLKLFQ